MPEDFQQRIRDAAARGLPLRIRGGGSKDFYGNSSGNASGNALRGEVLETGGHRGVESYEPTELVVTARAGTPLAELEQTLAAHNQMLPFEPPHFAQFSSLGATVGGCVAAGLSGPRRAAAGAVRDFVLGAQMIDGRGERLRFGGQVMKNVAGYDLSRLLTGSMGTLGLILEVSFKVLPRPPAESTVRMDMAQAQALDALNRWGGQPLPISASAWHGDQLHLRLSGAASAVQAAARKLGGEMIDAGSSAAFWSAVREQTHPFFAGEIPLWRLSLPSAAPSLDLAGAQLIEWGGALRWLRSTADSATIRAAAALAGGHATLFRAADKPDGAFQPLSPTSLKLHRGLKAAFDPAGIFNPGRLYPEF
jgi:glycolate oxidase FAD binding subunit